MSGKGSKQRPVDPASFAANWDRIFDKRESMRQANLSEARETILSAPDMSPAMQEKLDALWKDFDAAYPQPHELKPKLDHE